LSLQFEFVAIKSMHCNVMLAYIRSAHIMQNLHCYVIELHLWAYGMNGTCGRTNCSNPLNTSM